MSFINRNLLAVRIPAKTNYHEYSAYFALFILISIFFLKN